MQPETVGDAIARVEDPADRARLASMVPDPRAIDGYALRTLPGGRSEDELYRRAMDPEGRRRAVLLFGESGSGKTLSPYMFAARHGLPVAVIEGHNGFDPEVVWADRYQDPETGIWGYTESDATLICRYGNGVIIADEIGRIPPKSQSALFALFDDRRRITLPSKEVVRMADNVLIAATTNPPHYAGVSQIDPALWDRCSPVMEWGYSREVEKQLLTSATLLEMAWDVRKSREFETPMSTRQLVEFEELVADMGWSFARSALIARYDEMEKVAIGTTLDNRGPSIADELGVEYDY